MEEVKIRLTKNKSELEKAFEVRNSIFGREQKISRDLDFDGLDGKAKHVIAFYDNNVVGTARLVSEKDKIRLGRLSVLKKYRSKGIASRIMKYIITYCKKEKFNEIYFHSQDYIKGFYENLGFRTRGEPFNEAGIKHIEMFMKL